MFSKSFVFSSIIISLAYFIYIVYTLLNPDSPVSLVPKETWWGRSDVKNKVDDPNIYSFEIKISKQEIEDLHLRLNISRGFPWQLENTQHWFGLNKKIMQKIIQYLKKEYIITERLKFVNQYPQYRTQIHGLKIHFLHIKPKITSNCTLVPLLLLHGWPSSVLEFFDMIPLLTKAQPNQDFVFELVIAALPGFGYSEASRQKGFNVRHAAYIFKVLMNRLGHSKFYIHGSDWGAITATALATMFPKEIQGFHSNFCTPLRLKTLFRYLLNVLWRTVEEKAFYNNVIYPPQKFLAFLAKESGYFHMFGSKPDTIGVALDNSIEGLIAYNFEKLSIGSNPRNIEFPTAGFENFDLQTLMDITLFYYWFPKTSATSARFYAENIRWKGFSDSLHEVPIGNEVPCGCIYFEHEFMFIPESFLKDKYTNLVHYKTYPSSGHFAALELNSVLTEDIVDFVTKVEKTLHSNT